MIDAIRDFIGGSYAPHGYCLLWDPWLIWTMAVSDTLITLAYLSIPIALVTFVRKRRDIAFGGIFWLFALFITACGLTHAVSLWNLWNGDYGLEALIKAITAAASVTTAILLWPLLPKMIALPSPAHLRKANAALRAEIVEREKAEAALIQARKMEAMGQLTGGIAHDFNNLLQVISGSLDLIEMRTAGEERFRAMTDSAAAAVERGRRLTSQLLSFSRSQRLELRDIGVAELITGIREMLSRTIDPSIELRFQTEDAHHGVWADAVQLELAILNLALNARDAMPRGGTLTIGVHDRRIQFHPDLLDGDYLAITVADTGTGMTPDVVARAFEPFFTTKPVGSASGLGLSMVFGMARQSGGTVMLDSEPDKGSTVTILLRRAATASPVVKLPRLPLPTDLRSIAGLKILLVDDEPIVREVVSSMIRDLGCIVTSAGSGQDALALIDREAPSLLLLDFAMPGMNGAEVARQALERRPGLPIIFATGFAQSDAIDAVLGEDAIVLRKPFSPNDLIDAVGRAAAIRARSTAA